MILYHELGGYRDTYRLRLTGNDGAWVLEVKIEDDEWIQVADYPNQASAKIDLLARGLVAKR